MKRAGAYTRTVLWKQGVKSGDSVSQVRSGSHKGVLQKSISLLSRVWGHTAAKTDQPSWELVVSSSCGQKMWNAKSKYCCSALRLYLYWPSVSHLLLFSWKNHKIGLRLGKKKLETFVLQSWFKEKVEDINDNVVLQSECWRPNMVKFLYPLVVIGQMVTMSRTCDMKDLTPYPMLQLQHYWNSHSLNLSYIIFSWRQYFWSKKSS